MNDWHSLLICPIDGAALEQRGETWHCAACGFVSGMTEISGRSVPDFRAQSITQQKPYTFQIPVQPLNRYDVAEKHFRAANADFAHISRREIRRRFGTKLDKGIQFYCQQLLRETGTEARILDLGCGSGGNGKYLESLGFKNIVAVDWRAKGAELLVDAHRLPLKSGQFDMVISTAVFEHLYNPYLAMAEVSRMLKKDGYFVGGASFWEAWHGSSYFHFTPDGWNTLLEQNGMRLDDLWVGWGVIPSAFSHVFTPGYLRGAGNVMQTVVESVYRLFMGSAGVRKLQLRASGSYQVCARKAH
jgi:SAM-dependent methyltransferase